MYMYVCVYIYIYIYINDNNNNDNSNNNSNDDNTNEYDYCGRPGDAARAHLGRRAGGAGVILYYHYIIVYDIV